MKKLLIAGDVVVALMAVVVFSMLGALGSAWSAVSREEVARLTSPTGEFDAVVFEINGGATTSFGHEVHVVKAGEQLPPMTPIEGRDIAAVHLYGAVTAVHYGMILDWPDPARLVVQYKDAHNADLLTHTLTIGSSPVSVGLERSDESTPPAGGILYACCREPHILRGTAATDSANPP